MDLESRLSSWGIEVVGPHHSRYDEARRVFNGAIDRMPVAITLPRSEDEISKVFLAAREAECRVTVRGGGHNVAGRAVRNGAIVIDMRRFNGVELVDDGTAVRVGGGCVWADVDSVTATLGLAVPGGTVSSTGVGGLTLGGGIGWLLPSYGLTCDQLVGVEMVATDGRSYVVNDEQEPKLMACLRGAGHGLGVVTQFIFKLNPIHPEMTAGSLLFDFENAMDVLTTFFELAPSLPDSLMVSPCFMLVDGRPTLSVDLACNGPNLHALRFAASLSATVSPLSSTIRLMPWQDVQRMLDNPFRRGMPSYWKSRFYSFAPTTSRLAEAARNIPTAYCSMFVEHLHGKFRTPSLPSVFALRESRFDILYNGCWRDPRDEPVVKEWTTSGVYSSSDESVSSIYRNYADSDDLDSSGEHALVRETRLHWDPGSILVPYGEDR